MENPPGYDIPKVKKPFPWWGFFLLPLMLVLYFVVYCGVVRDWCRSHIQDIFFS